MRNGGCDPDPQIASFQVHTQVFDHAPYRREEGPG